MSFRKFALASVPMLFVVIWSTGWISAKYAAFYADPLWFLTIRFICAGMAISAFAFAVSAPWPNDRKAWFHGLVSGVLLHGLYLGGVWWAVKHGLSAGISGLLVALQPLLTAMLSPYFLKEQIWPRQWAGVILGFIGVLLVLSTQLGFGWEQGTSDATFIIPWSALGINIIGVLGITAGSFYQKKFVATGDLRTVTAVQYLGALFLIAPLALLTEDLKFEHNITTYATLAWSVFVLSVFAIGLMLMMINRGEVTRVSALIYLVPATVAIQAWVLFGETLTSIQIFGMVLTAAGVYLASYKKQIAP
jgi:drug/metabolite transporter (DMT)-like permease